MDNEKLDLSIDKYNIEDLLGIFGITEPTTKEVIMSLASEAINRYKALQQSKYAEFFSKAMNKLLSSWEDVGAIPRERRPICGGGQGDWL